MNEIIERIEQLRNELHAAWETLLILQDSAHLEQEESGLVDTVYNQINDAQQSVEVIWLRAKWRTLNGH